MTVGATRPFDRLVRAADELAAVADEPMTIQCGDGLYQPRFAHYACFVDSDQMQQWLKEARIVVSHAGAGSILGVIRTGKPLVLVPRLDRLGEHMDSHQFELAVALVESGLAVMVTDLSAETLAEAILQAEQLGGMVNSETSLHDTLRGWLAQQAARPPSRRLRLLRWLAGGR